MYPDLHSHSFGATHSPRSQQSFPEHIALLKREYFDVCIILQEN